MLRRRRYYDAAPRLEMTPMIDVVFLLLTFFIYSLSMMIQAQVLPVQLTTVQGSAQTPGESHASAAQEVQAITIDRQGDFYFNRAKVPAGEIDQRLADFARRPDAPTLYLAMEQAGTVDRGPLLLQLLERVRQAGITKFVIVGPAPADAVPFRAGSAPGSSTSAPGSLTPTPTPAP